MIHLLIFYSNTNLYTKYLHIRIILACQARPHSRECPGGDARSDILFMPASFSDMHFWDSDVVIRYLVIFSFVVNVVDMLSG